jgi:hypothetical protein
MAITFPIPLVDFADVLDVAGGTFRLSESRKFSASARGEVFAREGGARRWEGSVMLTPAPNARAGGFDVILDVLTGSGASALLYDHRRPYPALDPYGSILGPSTVVIASVAGSFKELVLSGLPSRYLLSRGDYLSFSYIDVIGAQQWSLHRVVDMMVEASDAGVTPTFEVSPHLPDDITLVGAAVSLVKPVCKVVLRPQTVKHSTGSPGRVSDGQSFEFVQTRR